MKIAIIGGGWVGCHLAVKLRELNEIKIFERNISLFNETSYFNQNRLHLGFHYARNSKTRELCKETFDKFMNDYGQITDSVNKNMYCIPNESSIDFNTYTKIFNDFNFKIVDSNLEKIEGSILTNERYINFKKAHTYFNNELSNLVIKKDISNKDIKKMSKEYDLVINCTNNQIKSGTGFYELTISLVYEKLNNIEFDSLTLVDGNFFSIYPYYDNKFTLTDVEHTPIKRFNTLNRLNYFKSNITDDLINDKVEKMESKVLKYYKNFKNDFKYDGYFLSIKSKIISSSDSRYPIIEKENNIVNCFTGKIQGIYIIENYIKNEINNR
jgi:hypothetical protein